ncbi:hypothetical protein ACJJIW_11660 [Microbulbifer sp. JMSA004]|uniref:hypothetical protein n=1 Tax=unclassified Microbulbifer TaxID=2619833 RepID=UPI0024AC82A7|nr:hypothetical protein [Microbulbifer sp. VAAF005]WHI45954.1 hypothetical protein P0078_19880 [Microbulbifer sp. VAAF005]
MAWNTFIEEISLENIPFSNDVLLFLERGKINVGEPKRGSVDLSKVVGTTHPDYCGKTWGQLKPIPGTSDGDFMNNREVALQGLKRAIVNVKALEKNPSYYFDDNEKTHWSFYQIDDKYYISSGNHRTVIGRLFLHLNNQEQLVHGVTITPAEFKKKSEIDHNSPSLISRFIAWIRP